MSDLTPVDQDELEVAVPEVLMMIGTGQGSIARGSAPSRANGSRDKSSFEHPVWGVAGLSFDTGNLPCWSDRLDAANAGHAPRPFPLDKLLEMTPYIDELGAPHLHLAGLKLWVHGYRYRDANDYWDGNWLHATALCAENGATVLVRGAFIRTDEIHDWQRAIDRLHAEMDGEAKLTCMEPEIGVTLKARSLGAIEMVVQITPDQLTQDHRFTFAIDQSYLPPLASQCVRLLSDFPIRGT